MMELKWYEYSQNNSGGRFIVNDDVTVMVCVQAPSPRIADAMAEDRGIYFDGCEIGNDCSCCGDRWHRADDYDAETTPNMDFERGNRWVDIGEPYQINYYFDGKKEVLIKKRN